jgi:dTDP-4-dehydrorhamnose reductase
MAASILVTGGGGQIGQELLRLRWPHELPLAAPDRATLDISLQSSVDAFFKRHELAAVINCAAYTAVDKAEDEIADAYAVNAYGPAWLASAARRVGIPMVHVSTDYVFGDGTGPRTVEDAAAPTSTYGASKLAGEIAIAAAMDRAVIVRTAWVVSPFRSNFLTTMLRLAENTEEIRVVADQKGCPTIAGDIALALQMIVLRMIKEPSAPTGTYHFVNDGEASWSDLAAAIMAVASEAGLPSARIVGIASDAYPTKVKRPADSRLDTSTLARDYGITPRAWQSAVRQVVQELAQTNQN